jgi:GR25 family glycosyltransferase involved in LPS biosynthesis
MVLDAFDHAFVINLDRDTQRYSLVKQRLKDVQIDAERFSAIVPTDKGAYESIGARGCTESHMGCVQIARDRGYQSVLILEDDVIFRRNFRKLWQRLLPMIRAVEYSLLYFYDWSQLSLTWFHLRIKPIHGTYCAHAYVVHHTYYDRMLELYAHNAGVGKTLDDFVFTSSSGRIFAPTYNLAGQDAGTSRLKNYAKDIRWSAHSKTYYKIPVRV